jgi:hypothetical protein
MLLLLPVLEPARNWINTLSDGYFGKGGCGGKRSEKLYKM